MNIPTISVIVPVYNTEQFLPRCIESILCQNYTDFELILIDDGSSDQSGLICDKYVHVDSRVHVFHQNNRGSSLSRKFGFDKAVGKYIATIDSDDWVDEDYLMYMYSLAENTNADLVMTAYYVYDNEKDVYIDNKPSSLSPQDWQVDYLKYKCHAGQWNKLVKREILCNADVLIPNYCFYEDMVLSISSLFKCVQVTYGSHATYHYRVNPNSLTNNKSIERRIISCQEMLLNMDDLLLSFDKDKEKTLVKAIYDRVNDMKISMVTKYPNDFILYKNIITKIIPESSSHLKITDLHSLAYYCSLKGSILPYRIITLFLYHLKRIFSY